MDRNSDGSKTPSILPNGSPRTQPRWVVTDMAVHPNFEKHVHIMGSMSNTAEHSVPGVCYTVDSLPSEITPMTKSVAEDMGIPKKQRDKMAFLNTIQRASRNAENYYDEYIDDVGRSIIDSVVSRTQDILSKVKSEMIKRDASAGAGAGAGTGVGAGAGAPSTLGYFDDDDVTVSAPLDPDADDSDVEDEAM